jgi:membrane protein DedA with SNARE-associated domain
MDAPATPVPTPLTSEQQQVVRLCLWTLAGLGTASMVGVAFSLFLVTHQPLLLIAMSPLGRHLLLAAPSVDPVAFVAVATLRRLAFYLACFHLGRALGPLGIPWIEARAARFARFVRWLERLFARAAKTVVLFMAGPTVAALAGISGMPTRIFVPLATAGLVARMLIVLFFAEALRAYLEIALAWIEEYWVPGTVVMVIGVGLYRWRRRAPSPVLED